MKKNITINLCGTLYAIDEDAYQLLEQYLGEMKNYFSRQEGGDEIADDIEHRVAELFWELKSQGVDAINIEQVKEIIQKIGNAQQMSDEQAEQTEHTEEKGQTSRAFQQDTTGNLLDRYLQSLKGKRLYRDMDDKILGGVCAGLTRYLGGSDPLPMRIILVLLVLFVNSRMFPLFWFWIICYLLLWVIMPVADTPEDKLKMQGKQVNPENLQEQILTDAEEKTKPQPVRRSAGAGCLGMFLKLIIFGIIAFWGFILLCILFAVLVAGAAMVGAMFSVNWPAMGIDDVIGEFLRAHTWGVTTAVVSAIVALVIPIYAIIRKLLSNSRMSGGQVATLFIIWIIATSLAVASCVTVSMAWKAESSKYAEMMEKAYEDNLLTQPYDFKNFTDLDVAGKVEVIYTQADSFSVTVEAPERVFETLEIRQTGSELTCNYMDTGVYVNLGLAKKYIYSTVKLYVTAPTLEKIDASGSVVLQSDSICQHSLKLYTEGAARVELPVVKVDKMDLHTKGAANVRKLNVEAQDFLFHSEGASKANIGMKGGNCVVNTEGASKLDLNVDSKLLKVNSEGASKINIEGKTERKEIDHDGASSISTVNLTVKEAAPTKEDVHQ